MAWELRNRTAIAGVGTSAFGRDTGRSNISLIAEAFRAALAECGLQRDQIDGLYVNAGVDVDRLAENLGLECRWAQQSWRHGRLSAPIIQDAALAASAGLADYVACVYSIDISERGGGFGGPHGEEEYREGGGPHNEMPWFGLTHPAAGAAMAMRRYMERYGIADGALGAVAVAQRAHAGLNPGAVMRKALTAEDYRASPPIIAPLRLLDFCILNDGAVCVIVTTAERARDLAKPPVHIAGMQGMRVGRSQFVFARPGLGVWQQDEDDRPREQSVYDRAEIDRSALDGLMIYDSFSPQVPFALEEYGFCAPGEAIGWLQAGHGRLGGRLPINTHGGHLSEGMLGGWGHQVEAVRQLRGECGDRQIPNARAIQYMMGCGVSMIYCR